MRWISGNTDQMYFVISGKELWLAVDDHHIKNFAMVQISADLILLDGPFKSLDPHYSVQWKKTLFSWYCIVRWLYFCYIFYFTFMQNKFTKHSYKSFHLVCKLISHQCKSKALTCSSGKTLARRALQIFLENNINVFFTQSSKIMRSCNSAYPLRSTINSIISNQALLYIQWALKLLSTHQNFADFKI